MDRSFSRRWALMMASLVLGGCAAPTSEAPDGEAEPAGAPEQVGAAEQALATPVSVTLTPSQDTTVRLSALNKNFGSDKELDINRTLVQFDTAAIKAAVGPEDVLVSAKFELTLTNNALRRSTAKRKVDAFRLTKAWTEKGATWLCAIDAKPGNNLPNCPSAATAWSMISLRPNPWASPATATITIAASQTGTASFDVTADVKKFLANAAANHGWMLRGSTPGEFAEFASRESATPPRLVLSIRRCSASLCDDGDACTVDRCDAAASCVHAPAANGTACDDGDACTSGDVCAAGVCGAGAPVQCAASDACHPSSCDPQSGQCVTTTACAIYGTGSIPGTAVGGLDVSPEVLTADGAGGTFLNDQVSAFGSAITYTGVGDLYVATPDRGPADGKTLYTDRYYLIDVSLAGGTVTPTLVGGATLDKAPGVPFLGKNTEFDATNSPASRRFDPEGVRVSPAGTLYISDEYGPFLYEFAANGDRIRTLNVPSKFLIANPALEAAELPPGNTSGRQANRGMEGLAISPDGTKLFGMMQNALLQDGALNAGNGRVGLNNRILEVDTQTGATREFLYKLADKAYGVSEIVAVDSHQFLVLERDSAAGTAAAFKRLFLIDIAGATDISGITALPETDTPAGVTPVSKTPFLDMLAPEYGLAGPSFPEKIEGLAFGPDLPDGRHVLVVTNDNDGVVANPNNFYVFAIGPAALPTYAPQDATFSSACEAIACDAQDACHKQGICNPGTAVCSAPLQPVGTSCGGADVCDASGTCAPCATAESCPGTDTPCGARTCTAGICGFAFDPAGTECGADQTCDGAGGCVTHAHVTINEVESNGGLPDDWVELYNAGSSAADLSGWTFLDGDDTHTPYAFPVNTVLQPGVYLVIDTGAAPAGFSFGLGTNDAARLFDAHGNLVDSYSWGPHAATTYGRCPSGTGGFTTTTSSTKGAANDCSVAVTINEVESNGGTPVDWIELTNPGSIAYDISGYVLKDNDDSHAFTIPASTVLAPGAYVAFDVDVAGGFGLGGADSARLFMPGSAPGSLVLIDSYTWAAHANITYARCPNGTGAFDQSTASTKGAANACGEPPPPPIVPAWPGAASFAPADGADVFGGDMSGLFYEPATASTPAVLWAVRNGSGTLFRLLWNGAIWTPDTADDWSAGKALKYPSGAGRPDSEGVTRGAYGEPYVFVATERDNDDNGVSKLSVLRFDTSSSGATLTATGEWNLTSDLPAVGANLGLEGIAYYPDAMLVAKGFRDELLDAPYDPGNYPGHGDGLFFVGVEANGNIYAYALDQSSPGTFSRLAAFNSGNPAVMDVTLDRDSGYLWALGDDTLQGVSGVFDVDVTPGSPTQGRFVLKTQLARPSGMPNLNNEGLAITPDSECAGGQKPVFWSDDGQTDGHALRSGNIPCGAFLP